MSAPAARADNIHASAVAVGEAGILIRGRSGRGKSALALALIELTGERGLFGRLIGDDRILAQACNGRLLLRGAPQISGLVERRGVGLEVISAEPAAVARLAVDLLDDGETAARLPEAADRVATFGPIRLRRLAFDGSSSAFERARAILAALPAVMTAL